MTTWAAILAIAVLPIGPSAAPAVAGDSALDKLNGSWSGTGRATFEGGKSERLRCRAYYRGSNGDTSRSFSIRCASQSGKVELRAALAVDGNAISGRWEERQHNATGSLLGNVSSQDVRLRISGGVSGGISVHLDGANRHSVSLHSNAGALQTVEIGLNRT